MATIKQLEKVRLNGKGFPDQLRTIFDKFSDRLEEIGIFFSDDESISPWSDESYLTDADWANPDIANNVLAMRETNNKIVWLGYAEDGFSFGIWNHDNNDDLSNCPPVTLDSEGQYEIHSNWADCFLYMYIDHEVIYEIQQISQDIQYDGLTPDEFQENAYNKLAEG